MSEFGEFGRLAGWMDPRAGTDRGRPRQEPLWRVRTRIGGAADLAQVCKGRTVTPCLGPMLLLLLIEHVLLRRSCSIARYTRLGGVWAEWRSKVAFRHEARPGIPEACDL